MPSPTCSCLLQVLLEECLAKLLSHHFLELALVCIAGLLDTGLVHDSKHTELCYMVRS